MTNANDRKGWPAGPSAVRYNLMNGTAKRAVLPDGDVNTDLVVGGENISVLIFGNPNQRTSVFDLRRTTKLPFFKLGGRLAIRPSGYFAFIRAEEEKSAKRQIGPEPRSPVTPKKPSKPDAEQDLR